MGIGDILDKGERGRGWSITFQKGGGHLQVAEEEGNSLGREILAGDSETMGHRVPSK